MKRLFDVIFSSLFLIICALPLIGLILVLRYKMGSPVFFKQTRPGFEGRLFTMVKFRTMTQQFSMDKGELADKDRLTHFGQFLRSTSLDELPELWNVLKGDMSIVGPRPLLTEYLVLYTAEQARRHDVRPGITGWAQVNGRNTLTWQEKFALDVWYVDNRSLLLDAKILLMTIKRVFLREGINSTEEISMPKFTGAENLPVKSYDRNI